MSSTRRYGGLFLKGFAMGAANVIPGVSGGTIAFITGIYEDFIGSIKSFDADAIKLFFQGKFAAFADHVNLRFLLSVVAGMAVSTFSLAFVITWLFETQEILTTAFFFGLIIASVYLVGKQVAKWSPLSIIMLLIGVAIAVGIAFLKPASENAGFLYLIVCGVVAICSMILPGLSGSYVLLIMGNYLLILNAVKDMNIGIIIPVAIGCLVGLAIFSRVIAYIFSHFRDGTIALLTGFVLGSLLIIWPWKNTITRTETLADGELKEVIVRYEQFMPAMDADFGIALAIIILGALSVIAIEKLGSGKN